MTDTRKQIREIVNDIMGDFLAGVIDGFGDELELCLAIFNQFKLESPDFNEDDTELLMNLIWDEIDLFLRQRSGLRLPFKQVGEELN